MRRLVLVLTLLVAVGCAKGVVEPTKAIEEKPWLRIERQASLKLGVWLGVVCDTTNDTLLYLYSTSSGSVALVVGGCK